MAGTGRRCRVSADRDLLTLCTGRCHPEANLPAKRADAERQVGAGGVDPGGRHWTLTSRWSLASRHALHLLKVRAARGARRECRLTSRHHCSCACRQGPKFRPDYGPRSYNQGRLPNCEMMLKFHHTFHILCHCHSLLLYNMLDNTNMLYSMLGNTSQTPHFNQPQYTKRAV